MGSPARSAAADASTRETQELAARVEQTPAVTVVVPTYNEADNLPRLVERLDEALSGRSSGYEIALVDDDSPDGTWSVGQTLAALWVLTTAGLPALVGQAVGVGAAASWNFLGNTWWTWSV